MRILLDMVHPADVLFFLHPIRQLIQEGHEVRIASRQKDVTIPLLEAFGISHQLASMQGLGIIGLIKEMIIRDAALFRMAQSFKPHVMAGVGGVAISHIGRLLGIPAIAFYDNDNAWLQNSLSFPFLSHVFVPEYYRGWLPRRRHTRVASFKELSYLHPQYFCPDRNIAIKNGLNPNCDNFFIRVVSWQASHDIGRRGWTPAVLEQVVAMLSRYGKVHVSSELPVKNDMLRPFFFNGDISAIHHVIAHCRLLVGDSGTMAAEAAVLGCPAILTAPFPSCFVHELDTRYGLVTCISTMHFNAIEKAICQALQRIPETLARSRENLLHEKIDMASFIVTALQSHAVNRM